MLQGKTITCACLTPVWLCCCTVQNAPEYCTEPLARSQPGPQGYKRRSMQLSRRQSTGRQLCSLYHEHTCCFAPVLLDTASMHSAADRCFWHCSSAALGIVQASLLLSVLSLEHQHMCKCWTGQYVFSMCHAARSCFGPGWCCVVPCDVFASGQQSEVIAGGVLRLHVAVQLGI